MLKLDTTDQEAMDFWFLNRDRLPEAQLKVSLNISDIDITTLPPLVQGGKPSVDFNMGVSPVTMEDLKAFSKVAHDLDKYARWDIETNEPEPAPEFSATHVVLPNGLIEAIGGSQGYKGSYGVPPVLAVMRGVHMGKANGIESSSHDLSFRLHVGVPI